MSDSENNKIMQLPLVALRGLVVFPKSILSFDVGRAKSVEAMEYALQNDTTVFLVAQKDAKQEDPGQMDMYPFGTVTKIRQILKMPGNMVRVLAEGLHRGKINTYLQADPYYKVEITKIQDDEETDNEGHGEGQEETIAIVRTAHEAFEQYAPLFGKLGPETIMEVLNCEAPGNLADLIGTHVQIPTEEKQSLLEEIDDKNRLLQAIRYLFKEIDVLTIQRDIFVKVKSNIDKNQKEYVLKEQARVIQEELGDKDGVPAEILVYHERMAEKKLPDYAVEKLEKEFKRLERSNPASGESVVIRDYVDWVLDLPWENKSKENTSLKRAQIILDKEHYGLEKVKERVVEFLAVRQNAPKLDAPILCLVGPPGVGKTSIAKSVAKSLNRQYVRMSLGGLRDEAEIRGHRKTYVGAMPGRIIYSMKQGATMNPVILLDEIDKMNSDFRGDPASAMLEVLDGEQNNTFRDHYLEIPYDLSDVLFICTANSLETVPQALRDRLEVISLSSYTEEEKLNIAMKFLLDKQLKKHGLKRGSLRIKEEAILDIIRHYTKEAGVRQLERYIGQLCRKSVKEMLMESNRKSVTIDSQNLEQYLGKHKFRVDKINEASDVGIARGLAWTSVGGDTLSIEVNTMRGTGKFELTGNMGQVMKESAQAAVSYIRSNYKAFNLGKNFYRQTDIHIHIPEGAVPKDGPSAGITMATAMISALSDIPVRNDVGMTGEITIRGRVLPIGGLKEKVLAAKNAGLKKIILPFDNEGDLAELSDYIKEGMEFVLAKEMDEVLQHALEADA